ncbi:MAG TPA: ANTAR domain-containing protein [Rhizobiales bacterium]|nr:ANTAR domain-containing protein [Hyphomicrobiales bacterium]
MTDGDVSAVMVALPQADTAMLRDVTAFAMAANCAVALFLESRANIHLGEIVDAGICSVVIDGLAASRIPDLLETTLYRYDKMRGLQIQLEKALSALEKRKLVDRAKALLIEQRGITEPEAHRLLQRAAMNKSCSINDIAQTIIIASEV